MKSFFCWAFLALTLVLFARPGIAATGIGTAISVTPGATLETGGRRATLQAGMGLQQGDTVRTDRNGQVQIVFADDTRIAVGPNSRLVIDQVLMRNSSRASRFTVSAVSGSIRFISGKSAKSAYAVRTPSATMGIRGTEFDINVDRRRTTSIMMFSGQVRMCGTENCAVVVGACSVAQTKRGSAVTAPGSQRDLQSLVKSGFPFVRAPGRLRPDFRASGSACGDRYFPQVQRGEARPATATPITPISAPPVERAPEPERQPERRAPPERQAAPEPERAAKADFSPEPPAPEPDRPAPEPASDRYPGQSGDSGPSVGRGNEVSQGQDGSGTGKGRGAENGKGRNNDTRGNSGNNGKGKGNGNGRKG
ncbi:FecR domain-containing protein [Tropicimonas sp. IMCC6043]|uniref:FecR family protein n=1 Tax=Tropicimonas sp. IMCC6043 TaxID=2510645 RepID=UPI00101BBC26|nr:FecR domain-containing protein [Tropicimonas sp. IMCC6043]RYH12010.1 hypothetical protein EU800_00110 [Tropicimonas sp. IMCC6043]